VDADVALTAAVREFLVRLEELLDAKNWPGIDRTRATPATGGDTTRVVLAPKASGPVDPIALQIDDRAVVVAYGPEHVEFTSRDEALQFIEMLGDGRVVLEIARNVAWTTMRSYRDGQTIPFRRTRMPWPTLRARVERRRFGFTD
jgi:hypothetical protein